MTRDDWLAGKFPSVMLEFMWDSVSARKLRLFAVACCRNVWRLGDETSRVLVELAERRADELVSDSELAATPAPDYGSARHFENAARECACLDNVFNNALRTAVSAQTAAGAEAYEARSWDDGIATGDYMEAKLYEETTQAAFVREIFGNPFRPVSLEPTWLTSDVLALAKGIYEERAFDRMPILADALQDAGCNNDDVLNHCRDTQQPHVRGCWVVDLLLGKE